MGSKRVGQVRFRAISGDHAGAATPHLHADIGSGEVVVEFLAGRAVRLSKAHGEPIRGQVTARELRLVLETARDTYDELISLWKASLPR
ncbi:MAG: DUF4160 domain-containing protein [Vulcanimicrobiaceae bacterium]